MWKWTGWPCSCGRVAGCLLVEPLESAPGEAMGDLPSQHYEPGPWSPLLMWLPLEIQEAGRRHSRNWSEGPSLRKCKENKITSWWIWRAVMPHCSAGLYLRSHLNPAEPPLSPPQSVLLTPGTRPLFYSPPAHTVVTSPVILTSKQMFCGKVYTAFTSLF